MLARDDRNWGGADPPGVVYFHAPSRGGQHAERFLGGFEGILQVDGYAGYTRLARTRKGVRLAYCWSHARRKLRDVFESTGSKVAAEGLRRIAELYAIEADIRGASPERRLAERQARTAPLIDHGHTAKCFQGGLGLGGGPSMGQRRGQHDCQPR